MGGYWVATGRSDCRGARQGKADSTCTRSATHDAIACNHSNQPASSRSSWARAVNQTVNSGSTSSLSALNNYKSVFSYLRTLTKWHCPHSPTAAAALDRYLLPAGPTAANLQQRISCRGSMLWRQTGRDGRYRTVSWRNLAPQKALDRG